MVQICLMLIVSLIRFFSCPQLFSDHFKIPQLFPVFQVTLVTLISLKLRCHASKCRNNW